MLHTSLSEVAVVVLIPTFLVYQDPDSRHQDQEQVLRLVLVVLVRVVVEQVVFTVVEAADGVLGEAEVEEVIPLVLPVELHQDMVVLVKVVLVSGDLDHNRMVVGVVEHLVVFDIEDQLVLVLVSILVLVLVGAVRKVEAVIAGMVFREQCMHVSVHMKDQDPLLLLHL